MMKVMRAIGVGSVGLLLLGPVQGCKITSVSGPSTVAPSAAISLILAVRCESTGDNGVLVVSVDVPDDWTAQGASLEGVINGAPTKARGRILEGTPKLLGQLVAPRAGFVRYYFGFGPFARVVDGDTAKVALRLVTGSRTGSFRLYFASSGANSVRQAPYPTIYEWTCMVSQDAPSVSFRAPAHFPAPSSSGGVGATVVDLDRDGLADYVLVASGSTVVSYRSVGGGAFVESSRIQDASREIRSHAVGDLNGDGHLDLVVLWLAGGFGITTYLGDGAAGFASEQALDRLLPGGRWFGRLCLADGTGDGLNDLLVSDTAGYVWLAVGNGQGGFGKLSAHDTGLEIDTIQVIDFNGDGAMDIVSTANEPSRLAVLLGDGLGGFVTRPTAWLQWSFSDAIATELNGDGKADVLLVERQSRVLYALLGDGSGGFAVVGSWELAEAMPPLALDIDRDGAQDVVVGSKRVLVLFGDGQGGFRSLSAWEPGGEPYRVSAGDVDGDGWVDLLGFTWVGGTTGTAIAVGLSQH